MQENVDQQGKRDKDDSLTISNHDCHQHLLITSGQKLKETADSLQRTLVCDDDNNNNNNLPSPTIRLLPCQGVEEAQGYRCRCSFQIFGVTDDGPFQYAVREKGRPVVIERFLVANWRIQQAMQQLLTCLNSKQKDDTTAAVMIPNLTSVTFVTSWNPSLDCLVTLHYSAPLTAAQSWVHAAETVRKQCGWSQLTGRSKGQILRALPVENNEKELMIRDTVYLQQDEQSGAWNVSLTKDNLVSTSPVRSVVYVKPESAFCHPNATVMCQALAWMLNRITTIRRDESSVSNKSNTNIDPSPTLMELYCGCGAHTMALIQSGLLHSVVAVELDERLVQACLRNAALNHVTDKIQIVSQDAGAWSSSSSSSNQREYDACCSILLVDPPRQGLDTRVCRMAADRVSIKDILYVSCGRDALTRDLAVLNDNFQVVDCVLLDLFPQTYSVESLVHLRRRKPV